MKIGFVGLGQCSLAHLRNMRGRVDAPCLVWSPAQREVDRTVLNDVRTEAAVHECGSWQEVLAGAQGVYLSESAADIASALISEAARNDVAVLVDPPCRIEGPLPLGQGAKNWFAGLSARYDGAMTHLRDVVRQDRLGAARHYFATIMSEAPGGIATAPELLVREMDLANWILECPLELTRVEALEAASAPSASIAVLLAGGSSSAMISITQGAGFAKDTRGVVCDNGTVLLVRDGTDGIVRYQKKGSDAVERRLILQRWGDHDEQLAALDADFRASLGGAVRPLPGHDELRAAVGLAAQVILRVATPDIPPAGGKG